MSLRERITGYFQEESAEETRATRRAYVDAVAWHINKDGERVPEEVLDTILDESLPTDVRCHTALLFQEDLTFTQMEVLLGADMFPFVNNAPIGDEYSGARFPDATLYELRLKSGEVDELIQKHQEAASSQTDEIDIEY